MGLPTRLEVFFSHCRCTYIAEFQGVSNVVLLE
jgi:hypothetical protein